MTAPAVAAAPPSTRVQTAAAPIAATAVAPSASTAVADLGRHTTSHADRRTSTIDVAQGGFASGAARRPPARSRRLLAPRDTPVHAVDRRARSRSCSSARPAARRSISSIRTDALLLLLRAPRSLRGRPARRPARLAGRRDRLRRHVRQRAARHAAPAFRDVRAERGSEMVAGPRRRSVSGIHRSRLSLAPPYRSFHARRHFQNAERLSAPTINAAAAADSRCDGVTTLRAARKLRGVSSSSR